MNAPSNPTPKTKLQDILPAPKATASISSPAGFEPAIPEEDGKPLKEKYLNLSKRPPRTTCHDITAITHHKNGMPNIEVGGFKVGLKKLGPDFITAMEDSVRACFELKISTPEDRLSGTKIIAQMAIKDKQGAIMAVQKETIFSFPSVDSTPQTHYVQLISNILPQGTIDRIELQINEQDL